ncbi:transcriptional regulator [Streptomyces sp. H39-S7]|uniref:transcriptional regulator n=1 Tax=Streptomyces sp. H39-S7 TaxID=3004357 RepID=UPI0022B05921|nr:transcriptional regulator [Streptomyces sp. H39-S7]MCZ4124346.1 transcriptional regulator [Streptomyces sp. H39-S7]
MSAATFAAVFIALYVAHSVGDHWVQTSHQSLTKGKPGWVGLLADARHITTLTATKVALLLPAAAVLGLHLSALGLVVGLGVDAVSHGWADRRSTLAWLARVTGKAQFYQLGTDTVHATTAADGITGKHIGTGAYALDQSFHHFWLLIAALVIAAV